ncbi:hypothetical protein DL546_004527 [Coniochaeta pulveracea]|uniref:Uncharacterized protein n=1 Tax=Coniochaeta pulveracea TaxID=177199 RepID=A0A420Y940_9PEZI|nr:hypothetical protein DL546_004527 [Coniochaeta pulveracea]
MPCLRIGSCGLLEYNTGGSPVHLRLSLFSFLAALIPFLIHQRFRKHSSYRHKSRTALTQHLLTPTQALLGTFTLVDTNKLYGNPTTSKASLTKDFKTHTIKMSPTYTMSAHLCKQIYTSWVQTHPKQSTTASSYPDHPASVPYPRFEKRSNSIDSDRSDQSDISTPSSRPTLGPRSSSTGSDKSWRWNRS